MTPKSFGDAETELFNELWAGALFDILAAVLTRCADWDKDAQQAMTGMIIQQLAIEWGFIDEPEEEAA